MNKKFSTLMLGMLLTSAFASAQTIDYSKLQIVDFENGGKVVSSGTYFVVKSADNVIDAQDQILSVVKTNGNLVYSANYLKDTNNDPSTYKWLFEVSKNNLNQYTYALKNVELGTYLTFPVSGNTAAKAVTDPKASEKAEVGSANTSVFVKYDNDLSAWINGTPLYAYGASSNGLMFNSNNGSDISLGGSDNIYLCEYKENVLDADDAVVALNDAKGGAGFNLKFSVDNKYEWANDILTDVNLKAFYVASDINVNSDTKYVIPAGVYFATEYPASLASKAVIETATEFEACTFVAVNPDKNYNINAAAENGIGFELMTVAGSAMNFYKVQSAEDKSESASVKGEVYVGNACFTVIEPDPLRAAGEYNFKLADFRHLKDLTKTEHVSTSGLYVGYVADQNKNYLITNESGLAFTTTNSTLYDVTKLLKSEDAPSIYTMQFVSEVNKETASEKGQYLTVGQDNNGYLALSAVENMNAADPMFQFVITAIDKENKTVTFANRQTKEDVTVSLYENEDGTFTVYAKNIPLYISSFNTADTEDGVVEFKAGNLQNTKVVLTPVTVEDKFATFVNRPEGAGLVTFEFANNIDDATALYVGISKNTDGTVNYKTGNIVAYANEVAQFELIKNENVGTVTNNYVYLNGERIIDSAKKDTVAYNTYKIKAFTEDNSGAYVTYASSAFKLGTSALDFVIKNNVDGSVSLINATSQTILTDKSAQYLLVKAAKDKDNAWQIGANYSLASQLSEGLKTFMVEENPAVSYEAVPQHVSFEAVRGGFLTKDENNDARLAITNTATEDLTFWLDTVHSDRNIPSFYIMKNGSFLYNSVDSAKVYANKGNYRFNLENKADGYAKLIFKAGELVTSDTIRTTVNGESVLVTYEDNAPKNIKGALKNFQFQIVRAEEGSDEYVIRNSAYQYVCQYNNYFYMSADKSEAYRFVIEKQAAPTANEGIEVSEVKVIAGNGQITIMGAAGKKVVVSNILGKVVASQTISSDNATIAVPAGIVAVAVEGEAAVKAVVK